MLMGELPLNLLQERIRLIHQVHKHLPNNFNLLARDEQQKGIPCLSTPEGQEFIEQALHPDTKLIVLDNISTLVRNGLENESRSWQPIHGLDPGDETAWLQYPADPSHWEVWRSTRDFKQDRYSRWCDQIDPPGGACGGGYYLYAADLHQAFTSCPQEQTNRATQVDHDRWSLEMGGCRDQQSRTY